LKVATLMQLKLTINQPVQVSNDPYIHASRLCQYKISRVKLKFVQIYSIFLHPKQHQVKVSPQL